MKLPLLR